MNRSKKLSGLFERRAWVLRAVSVIRAVDCRVSETPFFDGAFWVLYITRIESGFFGVDPSEQLLAIARIGSRQNRLR